MVMSQKEKMDFGEPMPKVDEDFEFGIDASFEEEKKSDMPRDSEFEDIRESELLDGIVPLPSKGVKKTDWNGQMFR